MSICLTDAKQQSIVLLIMPSDEIERAILETLTYSDIFDYPLRLDELKRYLPVRADEQELEEILNSAHGQIQRQSDFYYLAGRDEIVSLREQRETRSKTLLPIALQYGRILGALPFVRMVALTGSLAVLNVSKNADFDYMLVTKRGRVWTARLFAMAVNRMAGLFGFTLCPNLIVSETALEWPLHDLYSARELFQMIPITGTDEYKDVIEVNGWARKFLPNATLERDGLLSHIPNFTRALQKSGEFLLSGRLGDQLEDWEMTRKIKKFSKQPGFGEETIFTAEVCQGNFHHHRKWTKEVFEEKIKDIVIASRSVASGEAIPNAIREIATSPIGSSQ